MKETYCPFCDPVSQSNDFLLEETEHFRVIADSHPLVEGHILIIPKYHISCVGEYPESLFQEFLPLYEKCRLFIKSEYGFESTFEHGKIGQSVFHSHVHVLPFNGGPEEIISEGSPYLTSIESISKLKDVFQSNSQYLFFSIRDSLWIVDTALGFPRFFRDKFAGAFGRPERADWKQMRMNEELMNVARQENNNLKDKYNKFI